MSKTKTVEGKDLKVNDNVEVWWCKHYLGQDRNFETGNSIDIITKILPYEGPLLRTCFEKGARIAYFRYLRIGMTIPNDELFQIVK
jgi:hypothetical protein